MADWLLLRMSHDSHADASWMVADGAGRVAVPPTSGPLTQAAHLAPGRRLCVLVPGTDVLRTEAELPAKAGVKLHQVVPYALEESVADDIEDLHFALGRRSRPDEPMTPVAVVSRALMNDWLAALAAHGLHPEAMYADSDLLPVNPGQAVALLEDDTIVVRPVGGGPVTLPVDALADALTLVEPPAGVISADRAGHGLVLYAGAAEWQRHSAEVEPLRERLDGVRVQILAEGPLVLFAQQLAGTGAINLLQGPFAPESTPGVGWRSWRVAALLLAGLLVLHVAGKTAELVMLRKTEASVDREIAQTFRSIMPGSESTVDARRRIEQRLLASGGGGDSGLLGALSALSKARGPQTDTTIQALSFREGALELKVTAPNADRLDHLSQSLRTEGWKADLTSGNVAGAGYEGRIQIKPQGSS